MQVIPTLPTPESALASNVKLVVERLLQFARQAKTLESWLLWPSVPITQTGTNMNEGEVSLRMKTPAASAGRAGVGIAGGMRIK